MAGYFDPNAPLSAPPDESNDYLVEILRELKRKKYMPPQQQQGSSPDISSLMKIGKQFMPSGGTPSFGGADGGVGGSYLGGDTGLGFDLGGTAGQGTSAGGFMDGMFGGGSGGGASSGLMSNPYGWAAAIIGSANIMHNKDISPWSDTIKGKAGGNLIDYYQGRQDGKDHGIMSKILDKDGSVGQTAKGFTDFMEFDPKNAVKNTLGGVKSFFKGNLF